jgi:diguanylate cyclase (GGDEF)-like protein
MPEHDPALQRRGAGRRMPVTLTVHQGSAVHLVPVDTGRRTSRSLRAVGPVMVRTVRTTDLAARLKQKLRTLRTRVERRDALLETVRASNATLDPQKIANYIVKQAADWIPAPCWTLVAHDSEEQLVVLADVGLTPNLGPSLWAAAPWVMKHGKELFSADLAKDVRGPGHIGGTAIAFPLTCRGRVIGALIGLDPAPSTSAPILPAPVLSSLRALLEPPSIALDNALSLQRAEALSVTDDLTRLYNSRYLNQVLRRETKRASRSGRPLSVLFIDLDGFKQVNDTHGHLCGSKALVEAAALIRGCARETDVVARFGGDEFSLILPETGREGAVSVAERIRTRISEHKFLASDGLAVHLTTSVGVATLPDVAGSAEELIRAADMAMYRVKDAGKDGIHVAQEQEEGHPSAS